MGLFEPSAGDFWEMKEKEKKRRPGRGRRSGSGRRHRRTVPMRCGVPLRIMRPGRRVIGM